MALRVEIGQELASSSGESLETAADTPYAEPWLGPKFLALSCSSWSGAESTNCSCMGSSGSTKVLYEVPWYCGRLNIQFRAQLSIMSVLSMLSSVHVHLLVPASPRGEFQGLMRNANEIVQFVSGTRRDHG